MSPSAGSQRITHEDNTVSPSAGSQRITHEDNTVSPSVEIHHQKGHSILTDTNDIQADKDYTEYPTPCHGMKLIVSPDKLQQPISSERCNRYPQRHYQPPLKLRQVNHTTIGRINNISVKTAINGPRALESKLAIIDEIKTMISYQVGYYTHWDDIPAKDKLSILRTFMFIKYKEHPD
jgi:hypothetical protein